MFNGDELAGPGKAGRHNDNDDDEGSHDGGGDGHDDYDDNDTIMMMMSNDGYLQGHGSGTMAPGLKGPGTLVYQAAHNQIRSEKH